MNRSLYEKRLSWNPVDYEEHIIDGANHTGIGDYGKQLRGNAAGITAENQQNRTAGLISDR